MARPAGPAEGDILMAPGARQLTSIDDRRANAVNVPDRIPQEPGQRPGDLHASRQRGQVLRSCRTVTAGQILYSVRNGVKARPANPAEALPGFG